MAATHQLAFQLSPLHPHPLRFLSSILGSLPHVLPSIRPSRPRRDTASTRQPSPSSLVHLHTVPATPHSKDCCLRHASEGPFIRSSHPPHLPSHILTSLADLLSSLPCSGRLPTPRPQAPFPPCSTVASTPGASPGTPCCSEHLPSPFRAGSLHLQECVPLRLDPTMEKRPSALPGLVSGFNCELCCRS